MKRAVYYFSGTGNSLRAAQDLADQLGAELVPIAAFWDCETVETDAELIGIVFPNYYGDAPIMVQEFIEKIQNLQSIRVFAVCTYGGAAMDSLRTVRRLLQKHGGKLSVAFGVPMPQNSFDKKYENRQRRYAMWERSSKSIARKIEEGASGIRYHNHPLEWLMVPVTKYILKPVCKQMFFKQSGLPKDAPAAQMMRFMDKGFVTLKACNGCGVCARVCPAGNIVITNGKPVWQHRCENCLACYNWCPQQAITGGITKKGYFYRHPQVSLKDFIPKQ